MRVVTLALERHIIHMELKRWHEAMVQVHETRLYLFFYLYLLCEF